VCYVGGGGRSLLTDQSVLAHCVADGLT
jgi:hypothetical protein